MSSEKVRHFRNGSDKMWSISYCNACQEEMLKQLADGCRLTSQNTTGCNRYYSYHVGARIGAVEAGGWYYTHDRSWKLFNSGRKQLIKAIKMLNS